ncbi:suppressor protein stp22 of temperature-sensitive alpha-factor receptor and arginine permease [Malassezia sp. CBS 17886]|nr:suppressor protein stp22 of temperature-sensitive alpha-factor receptor and arginine permease [Malassezia sp. CBS 17886]
MDRNTVQRWLRQVLGTDWIYADVDTVLNEFPSLLPSTDIYTYDDGRTALLLRLGGTVPVQFRGQEYHIPVHIWFPHDYPNDPPMVYVVPTAHMLVRESAQVDPGGRVSTGYLSAWHKKSEGCSALDLRRRSALSGRLNVEAASGRMDLLMTEYSSASPPTLPTKPPTVDIFASLNETDATPSSHPPPPQRPMNPELAQLQDRAHAKLAGRLQQLRASMQDADAQLRVLHDDLERGTSAIHDETQRLQAVKEVCTGSARQLAASVEQAAQRTVELRAKADPAVDSMLVATNLAENQLLQLMAEDQAIEDTLYQLGRALHSEQLSLDRFIKHTRMLAREQFMRRALAQKIASGMSW